ncbi:hypothetical protein HRI_003448600 [Hibiscus trionum]|uniref:Uncharacterized protein n=1 Tax=Hibiscus trionum TaxID=183268 RepID=A0A9W7IPJ5_HIBTR|nr:hypothetical protein HRI_003448600 [Hibiscus trionum]
MPYGNLSTPPPLGEQLRGARGLWHAAVRFLVHQARSSYEASYVSGTTDVGGGHHHKFAFRCMNSWGPLKRIRRAAEAVRLNISMMILAENINSYTM